MLHYLCGVVYVAAVISCIAFSEFPAQSLLQSYFVCYYRCIDGYSRRLIWLQCGSSNHSPGVIAGYFKDAVEVAGGRPANVRTDAGQKMFC
jgi:hypothetical protein